MATAAEVSFHRMPRDPSLEAAIQLWVASFEAMRIELRHASASFEPAGRGRTMVSLTLHLADGNALSTSVIEDDTYFGIADAFRQLRQEVLYPHHARTLAYVTE